MDLDGGGVWIVPEVKIANSKKCTKRTTQNSVISYIMFLLELSEFLLSLR